MCLATVDSSQACHSFQVNMIGLQIPTGKRHTSWQFTSMTEELNQGEWDFKLATSDFKSCTLATLPPTAIIRKILSLVPETHVKTPKTPSGVSIVKGLHWEIIHVALHVYKSVSISVFVIVITGSPHSSTSSCKGIDWVSF